MEYYEKKIIQEVTKATWMAHRNMVIVFANGPSNRGPILGWIIQKTQKMGLDAFWLTLSIIRNGSRVNRAIQWKKKWFLSQHLGVVAI